MFLSNTKVNIATTEFKSNLTPNYFKSIPYINSLRRDMPSVRYQIYLALSPLSYARCWHSIKSYETHRKVSKNKIISRTKVREASDVRAIKEIFNNVKD